MSENEKKQITEQINTYINIIKEELNEEELNEEELKKFISLNNPPTPPTPPNTPIIIDCETKLLLCKLYIKFLQQKIIKKKGGNRKSPIKRRRTNKKK